MPNSIITKGMRLVGNCYDKILISHRRNTEIKKFKDERRIEIYSRTVLTESQMKAIDDLYLSNYGEKIPYIWHRYFTAYTGNFDVNYFPELIGIPEFERFMNLYNGYDKVFADKNVLPFIAKSAGIKVPETIFSATRGTYKDNGLNMLTRSESVEFLKDIGEGFMKPSVDSCSGQGCCFINFDNGVDTVSGKTVSEILTDMGNDFVIQRRIKCHKSFTDIYPGSVNTFRIRTYRWKEGIEHIPSIMRIGSGGGFVDNAHAGGMFVAVDDDGTYHDTAFTEFNTQFKEHPDTHFVFDGYNNPLFVKALKAAKRMHAVIPQIGVIHWDFTLGEDGEPILIEANTYGGGFWSSQMSHGRSAFGDKTAEVLRWMRVMKKTKPEDRHKIAYGQL